MFGGRKAAAAAAADEEPLQAVVVADAFGSKFAPALDEIPFALLPIAGVPIVDYTLEALAQAGVNETFLFCTTFPDKMKAHVRNAKNAKAAWSVTMNVHIIVSEDCQSFGDALRDLDAKGLVNGHFVLVGADTISNVKLIPLMEKHKEICKKDKGAAMTLVFKTASPDHYAQRGEETILLADDADVQRVLSYRKIPKQGLKKVDFPIEIFLEHGNVEIHSDLVDTHIAICSPSVLPLFADNFDFQTRDDFVKGILMNEEILASTLYWHRLRGDQYAMKITNWQTYQIVSQDIMHRWVFPLVPDMTMSKQQNKCMLLRNHVYQHADVKLAKICTLEEFVVLSSGSSIGENTLVTRSAIGKNCTIGADCHISDSHIMDDCTIGDGCRVVASIISANSKLGANVQISSAIVGNGVQLEENCKLNNCLVRREPTTTTAERIGNCAYSFDGQVSNDNESNDSVMSETYLPEVVWPTTTAEWQEEESEAYSSSSDDDTSRSASPVQEDANLFLNEVIDSLARGYEEKLKCDYLILEINSSRYAYNMSLQEVNFYVVQALFTLPPMTSTTNVIATLKDLYKYFTPVMANYIKGSAAMMDCLSAIEDCCEKNDILASRIAQVIDFLYEKDVISEDTITEWYEKMTKENKALSKNSGLKKFIEWLEEASEESGED